MKIWLDDQYDDEDTPLRKAPDGFTPAHSVNEVKRLVEQAEANNEEVELLDIDNDLGQYSADGGDGHKILEWLIERNTLYPVKTHSKNIVEAENIRRTIDRHWPKQNNKIIEKK